MREPFWEDVKPGELKARMLKEISTMAIKAKPGDVVNIIIECHGSTFGEMRIGSNSLSSWEFARALDAFSPGVQVNAINTACHSGLLVDTIQARNTQDRYIASACSRNEVTFSTPRSASGRHRGSRYEQAWVQSFAKLDIHGRPQEEDTAPKTLREHEEYIVNTIHRNFSMPREQTPQYWTSSNIALDTAIEDMILRDKIDVLYDPRTTARRRRIEWPSLNPDMLKSVTNAQNRGGSPEFKQEAIELLEEELSKGDPNSCVPCDAAVYFDWPPYYKHNELKNLGDLLTVLYWRGRLQSACLDVFTMLVDRGFVSISNLAKPYNIHTGTDATTAVALLLSTFEAVVKEEAYVFDLDNKPHSLWEGQFMMEPINWLATMIVRGCANIQQLFDCIIDSKFLGGIDETALEKFKTEGIAMFEMIGMTFNPLLEIVCNPNERVATTVQKPDFGFWLPHGLGDLLAEEYWLGIYDCVRRFNRIERVYKKFFGIPDDELLTEEEQAAYIDTHREEYPGNFGRYLRMKHNFRIASGGPDMVA
jgi:hypothetical protein